MSMGRLPVYVVLGLGLLPVAASATNVIVIIADDIGADKIAATMTTSEIAAAHYLPATPTLDDLGTAGLTFTHAWAAPICSPSRATFLTGDYPHTNGVAKNVAPGRSSYDLTTAETTLAGELAAAGWDTGAFGKWHLGNGGPGGTYTWTPSTDCPTTSTYADSMNPLLHGFNYFDGDISQNDDSYTGWWEGLSSGDGTTQVCVNHSFADEVVVDTALDWIAPHYDAASATWDPYFAYVAIKTAHFAADGPGAGYNEVDIPTSCGVTEACLIDGITNNCGDGNADGVDDEQLMILQAMIECMDGQIEDLLLGIDAMGPGALDDTLIVFWGDNGTSDAGVEYPFNQTATYGKGTMYETGLRVPLYIAEGSAWLDVHDGRRPSTTLVTRPGRAVTKDIMVTDLYDTLSELVGVTPTGTTDGESFAACFASTAADCGFRTSRVQYSELYNLGADGTTLISGSAAYKRSNFKLQATYVPASNCLQSSLYDLNGDPYELTDIQPTYVATTTSMRRTLERLGVGWYPRSARGNVVWCR